SRSPGDNDTTAPSGSVLLTSPVFVVATHTPVKQSPSNAAGIVPISLPARCSARREYSFATIAPSARSPMLSCTSGISVRSSQLITSSSVQYRYLPTAALPLNDLSPHVTPLAGSNGFVVAAVHRLLPAICGNAIDQKPSRLAITSGSTFSKGRLPPVGSIVPWSMTSGTKSKPLVSYDLHFSAPPLSPSSNALIRWNADPCALSSCTLSVPTGSRIWRNPPSALSRSANDTLNAFEFPCCTNCVYAPAKQSAC